MQYIVDIILGIIIVFTALRGRKRGLVKTVFGITSVIAAIMLAYIFGSQAGSLIRTTKVYDDICKRTEKSLAEYFEQKASDSSEQAFEDISGLAFVKQLENMGIDTQEMLEKYSFSLEESADETTKTLSESIVLPVLELLSNIVGTVAVFGISLLVLWILSNLLSGIFRLPFLRSVNSAGGFIMGLILGLFYAFILCMIIKSIIPCIPQNPVIYTGMENDTVLYKYLTQINPLYLVLIGKFFN